MSVTTMTVAAKKAEQQAKKAEATNNVAQPEVVEETTSPIAKRSITCMLVVTSEGNEDKNGDPLPEGAHFLKGTFTMSTSDLEFSWFWTTDGNWDRPCLAIAKSDKFQRSLKTAVNKRLWATWLKVKKFNVDEDGDYTVGQVYRTVIEEIDEYQTAVTV
mgnify:CR=1 FL=1